MDNFHGFLMQQLLKAVPRDGFYLDVGAFMPSTDSNTYLLYQHGWSGLVVEPLACLHQNVTERWAIDRPRDFLVRGLAADYNGTHEFYPSPTGQCSTGSRSLIERYQREQSNLIGEPIQVSCWTLNFLLDQNPHYSQREIHFMSLDAENMENEVLRGFDLRRYRPWFMMIENTVPGPLIKSDLDESLLIDYRKIHDDGVNGFYMDLDKEHSALWSGLS